MGVNDITMAVTYKYEEQPPLSIPVLAFEGGADGTIPKGFMSHWRRYTSGLYRHVVLPTGDHYFVSALYREVRGCGDWCSCSKRPARWLHAQGRPAHSLLLPLPNQSP